MKEAASPAEVLQPPVAPPLPVGTLLEPEHEALKGHMVDFHGWRMPLYYQDTGILAEHRAVRGGLGLFDVSHMGMLVLEGEKVPELLSRRTPANTSVLKTGACKYSFFLDMDGRIIDDAVMTRLDHADTPRDFLLVVNASMTPRILELLQQHRLSGTRILAWNGQGGIIAAQGPRSRGVIESLFGWDLSQLKFYTSSFFPRKGGPATPFTGSFVGMMRDNIFVSRTGYTGELGYELFVPREYIRDFWRRLIHAGGIPCGLGARDTLRMEKGYLLSGVDFQEDRTPIECGLDRFVSLDHIFVGRPALERQLKEGGYPVFTGISVDEKGVIPRSGTPIFKDGVRVGIASSGGLSPTLGHGIALSFLPENCRGAGVKLELELRGRKVPAIPVSLPFVR